MGDTGQYLLNSSLATSEMILNVVCVILIMTIITALVSEGSKQLKLLELLIRFLCFPECPFLLHGVEHSVAILSLVLVRETDDRQLSVILFYVYK